jgi:hypothetical protein
VLVSSIFSLGIQPECGWESKGAGWPLTQQNSLQRLLVEHHTFMRWSIWTSANGITVLTPRTQEFSTCSNRPRRPFQFHSQVFCNATARHHSSSQSSWRLRLPRAESRWCALKPGWMIRNSWRPSPISRRWEADDQRKNIDSSPTVWYSFHKDLVKRCNKYLVSKIMMDSFFNKYLVKYVVKYLVNTWIFLVKYLVKRCYSTG